MKQILMFIIFISSILTLEAQDSSDVYFFILPKDNAFLRIDKETVIPLSDKQLPFILKMTTGKHFIEVWLPEYAIYQDTITVKEGKINRVSIGVKQKENGIVNYSKKNTGYWVFRTSRYAAYGGILTFNILRTINTFDVIKTERSEVEAVHQEVLETKDLYERSISLSRLKYYETLFEEQNTNYQEAIIDFNKFKTRRLLIDSGIYIASAAAAFGMYKINLKKPQKPTFDNPFLKKSTTQIYISPSQIGLSINF